MVLCHIVIIIIELLMMFFNLSVFIDRDMELKQLLNSVCYPYRKNIELINQHAVQCI